METELPVNSAALKHTGIISTFPVGLFGGGGMSQRARMIRAQKCENISTAPLMYLSRQHLNKPANTIRKATNDTRTIVTKTNKGNGR